MLKVPCIIPGHVGKGTPEDHCIAGHEGECELHVPCGWRVFIRRRPQRPKRRAQKARSK